MKQMFLILFLFFALYACKEESVDVYAGECGIYFDTRNIFLDTISVAWGLQNSDVLEQTLTLKVKLFGNVATYDRKFSVDVVSEADDSLAAVEGVDFRPIVRECILPALQAQTEITLQLLRTPILKTEARRFTIRLNESSELKFLYSREQYIDSVTTRLLDTQRVIYMSELFPKPTWWSYAGQGPLGDWSVTKSILICDVMNISRTDWIAPLTERPVTQGYLKYVGRFMHRWLQENPTMDENGELMKMGPDSLN